MNKVLSKDKAKEVKSIQNQIRSNNKKGVHQLFLKWSRLKPSDMLYFTLQKWNFLTFINLLGNQISNIGCKYLSRANIKNLEYLNLSQNLIESIGVDHLSKAQWKYLDVLYLNFNRIATGGIGPLTKMLRAPDLSELYLNDNKLTEQQMTLVLLLSVKAPNIYVHLSDNLASQRSKDRIKGYIFSKFILAEVYI